MKYGPRIVTNGLVMLVDASDTNSYSGSGTSLLDLSGNNYHSTLYNAPLTTVDNVKCFNVSTTGYIDRTSTSYTFGSSHTMIAWARPLADSQVTTWRTLWRTSPNDHPILIQDSTNLIGYYDNDAAGFVSYGLNAGTIGIENKWTMFTLVASGGSTTLYINGTTYSGTVAYSASGNSHYTIGSTSVSANQPFGYVASALLYSRNLSISEVKQMYDETRSRFKT